MAVNEEQHAYFCAACGDAITEADFKAGEAIHREDKAYCRKCFRKTYPDECEMHPGVEVSVRCSVCMRMYCENCVIEIAGKQVCSRCKDWALDKLADGEELTPDSSLFPDFDEAREKRLHDTFKKAREAGLRQSKSEVIRDQLLFRPWDSFILFYVGMIAIGILIPSIYWSDTPEGFGIMIITTLFILLMLFISLILPKLIGRGLLRTVQVDGWGISGTTFRGKKKQVPWNEIVFVTIRRPNSSRNLLGNIKIFVGKKSLTIGTTFPRFMFIADVVRDICKEKNIKYEEKAV